MSIEIIDVQRSYKDMSENIVSVRRRNIIVKVWDKIYLKNFMIGICGKSPWKYFTHSDLEDPEI